MTDYDKVWTEMAELAQATGTGQFRRRIAPESKYNIFIGLEKPSDHRLLLFSISTVGQNKLSSSTSTRAVTLLVHSYQENRTADISLLLIDNEFRQIFSVLVEDLVEVITRSNTESQAITSFFSRWQQWQRFLERIGVDGLGREEQIGLYGELWLLRSHLLPTLGNRAIDAWVGPQGAPRDFRLGTWAIEVKSTTILSPQAIIIANEFQLDAQGFAFLFLYWLALDAITGGSDTLPVLIDTIRASLAGDSQRQFEELLLEAGYLEVHRHLYEQTSYTIRNAKFFSVEEGFPRIVPDGLPAGVKQVQYSILLQSCQPYITSTDAVIAVISGDSHDQ